MKECMVKRDTCLFIDVLELGVMLAEGIFHAGDEALLGCLEVHGYDGYGLVVNGRNQNWRPG